MVRRRKYKQSLTGMQGRAYNCNKAQKAWVHSEFLEKETQICPDLNGIICASKVNFN